MIHIIKLVKTRIFQITNYEFIFTFLENTLKKMLFLWMYEKQRRQLRDSYSTCYRFCRLAFGECQMFLVTARALRNIFPLSNFGFSCQTTFPGCTLTGTKSFFVHCNLDSFLSRLKFLTIIVAWTLVDRNTFTRFG